MNGRGLLRIVVALVAALLVGGALGSPALARQATPTPIEVVQHWIDTLNKHDADGQRRWSDPSLHLIGDPGTPDAVDETLDEHISLLPEDVANELLWIVRDIKQTAPDTVVTEVEIQANDIPPLPHPVMVTFTFTVGNGRVTHVVGITSPQTAADFAALAAAPTGMPKTGSGFGYAPLLLLGALLLALGVILRRARPQTVYNA